MISGNSGFPDPDPELPGINYYESLSGVIFQNPNYFFPNFPSRNFGISRTPKESSGHTITKRTLKKN
jgi:hypothetical protein